MNYQILQGDNRQTLKTLADNSIDAIITDPPYGIDFLGKDWDANTGALETYQECLRVLKPGGHILAFSAARTYHHLAITLEQAGFEIRDQIMWIYSSGFPKSQGVKTHPGWGTCLKPAHEPIALARKPIRLSIKANMLQHNVGGLNIDACRVPFESEAEAQAQAAWKEKWAPHNVGGPTFAEDNIHEQRKKKKKSDTEIYLDNKRGPMERSTAKDGEGIGMFEGKVGYKTIKREVDPVLDLPAGRFPSNVLGDIPDYQKYFYCPKVSRRERHIGFDDPGALFSGPRIEALANDPSNKLKDAEKGSGNNHPTVKPIELMKYLIRLITPAGGTVLDPFNGSGSTGCAAVDLGHPYIGCELDENYVEIAKRRIDAWYALTHPLQATGLFE